MNDYKQDQKACTGTGTPIIGGDQGNNWVRAYVLLDDRFLTSSSLLFYEIISARQTLETVYSDIYLGYTTFRSSQTLIVFPEDCQFLLLLCQSETTFSTFLPWYGQFLLSASLRPASLLDFFVIM